MRGFKTVQLCVVVVLVAAVLLRCTTAQTTPTPLDSGGLKICGKCGGCGERIDPDTPLILNCASADFTSIPVEDLQDLRDNGIKVSRIDFSYNKITHIQTGDFSPIGNDLVSIDLRSNRISTIDDEAFSVFQTPRLTTLLLGMNLLNNYSFPLNVMTNVSLRTLDLSHNRLINVPRALANAERIETLRLNNNPIYKLGDDSLTNISQVSSLDLSSCGLTSFETCNYDHRFFSGLNELILDLNNFGVIKASYFVCNTKVPPLGVLHRLSMQYSNITSIERKSFLRMPQLEYLYLRGNNLGIFKGQVFKELDTLIELDLSECNITDLKGVLFRDSALLSLFLNHNNIRVVHEGDFEFVGGIKRIDLSNSNIQRIDGTPFQNLTNLNTLTLANNLLDDRSISGLGTKGNFYALDLSNNNFTRIPNLNVSGFKNLRDLLMSQNRIEEIHTEHLRGMSALQELILFSNRIRYIEDDAFTETPILSNLDLDSMHITSLPRLPSTLLTLYLRFGELNSLPDNLCEQCPRLIALEVDKNNLTALPFFQDCKRIQFVSASDNSISTLNNDTFKGKRSLRYLSLSFNGISSIPDGFFRDTVGMEHLYLAGNKLTSLSREWFSTMPRLTWLNISDNALSDLEENLLQNQTNLLVLSLEHNNIQRFRSTVLPVNSTLGHLNLSVNNLHEISFPKGGLLSLVELDLEENFDLLKVPDVAEYPNITKVWYSYSYHCCIWQNISRGLPPYVDHDQNNTPTVVPTAPPPPTYDGECDENGEHTEASKEMHREVERNFGIKVLFLADCKIQILWNDTDTDFATSEEEEVYEFFTQSGNHHIRIMHHREVQCYPRPDELSPCHNLMDPWPLRVCVWGIWILAVLGNVTVLFITFISKEKMEVYQFLICCLAFADLCMGIYLAFLAATDIRTFGDVSFYQAVLQWQLSAGCQVAGFLAVFGSELSVLILVVLTLERVHTIANALKQNEKGKKKMVYAAAAVCALIAAFLACLPFFGINSYQKVAVCLPYLTEDPTDKLYIGSLLTLNLIGFLVILFSYVYIFRNICKSPAAHQKRKDISVAAAKISLLILTTFVCWMPIVVIGYLALADVETVNTGQAKYLVVLVYPLNACLNPFIYAIFTRQFRQKVSDICKCNNQISSLPNSRRSQLKRGSSAFLNPTSSPRGNLTSMELINLRQSKRSQSFSVHQVSHNSASPSVRSPPVLSPPPGMYMGRRSSLPAGFGSALHNATLQQVSSNQGSLTANNSTADISDSHPFTFAKDFGVLSQPDLKEVEANFEASCNLQSSLGGSQESANRQLPDIPEEQEEETAYSSCSEDYRDACDGMAEEDEEVLPETVQLVYEEPSDQSVAVDSAISPVESIDSAYSGGGNCATPEDGPVGLRPTISPTHSCILSRESESFFSYDLSVSDSEGAARENVSAAPCTTSPQHKYASGKDTTHVSHRIRLSKAQTCVDSQTQITYSPSHESRDPYTKLKIVHLVPINLDSPHKTSSNSQISIIGSETSV